MAVITSNQTQKMPDYRISDSIVDPTGGGGDIATVPEAGSTGGGSSSGYYNYLINQQKLATEAASTAKRAEGIKAQEAYLRGQLGQGVPESVSKAIEAQRAAGEQYIKEQEAGLLGLLGQRYGQATETTGGTYARLQDYLTQNAPTAYAQAQRAVPRVYETALGQYMAGQGVSPEAARTAVEVQNVLGAGGAANYNQLLNVLAAREAASQQSRLAEAQLARTGALTGLENLYTGSQFQVQQQRLAALADLANRINAARLTAEQQASARDQAIRDALSSLYGTGYVTPPVEAAPGAPVVPPLTPLQQLQQLTVNAPTRNPALAARVQQLATRNPNATVAQIQRLFPQLGQRVR
jgi:hypothetical protein